MAGVARSWGLVRSAAVLALMAVSLLMAAVPAWAEASFEPVRTFSTGPDPVYGLTHALTSADFNGDGRTDLAVANRRFLAPSEVKVLLGRGDGTFSDPQIVATGINSLDITSADFDGNGTADLAFTNGGDTVGNVSVLLGRGDGTFEPEQVFQVGKYPASVTSGDFLGDGGADLAVANVNSGTVSVLYSRPDSAPFSSALISTIERPGVWAVTSADFARDSRPDLAVLTDQQGGTVEVWHTGFIFPGTTETYQLGSSPDAITSADLTGNGGKADIATANDDSSGASVSVLLGPGEGEAFAPASTFSPFDPAQAPSVQPMSLTAADFDDDGNSDLALADEDTYNNHEWLIPGTGGGGFGSAKTVDLSVGPIGSNNCMIHADFDDDSHPDLAACQARAEAVSVLINAEVASPSTPDLLAASDSGLHDTDDVTNNPTPTFVGTAEAGSTVALFADGVRQGSATATGGNYSIAASGLTDGRHTVTATATDADGNTSEPSGALDVTIDTTAAAPSSPDLLPTSDTGSSETDNITADATPTFDIAGIDPDVASVEVFDGAANGGSSTSMGKATADSSGDWSFTSAALQDGTHRVTTIATDKAGNVSSASSPLTLVIDTASPTVLSTGPPDEATGVSRAAAVKATFSEKMMATTLTPTNVQLFSGASARPIKATLSLDPATDPTSVTLTTSSRLDARTIYTVKIGEGNKA